MGALKAKHLTAGHVGRLVRVQTAAGAIVEAKLRSLTIILHQHDDTIIGKASYALDPDRDLRIEATFQGLEFVTQSGAFMVCPVILRPSATVNILD